jgi:hypothetical protein
MEDQTGLDGRPSQQESRPTQRKLEDGLKTEYIDVATFRQHVKYMYPHMCAVFLK